ncbi:hypothetical protein ACKKBG_A23055 [Auxenochlorella protothecoides x Auxenochlorella symbiontica]
MQLSRLNHALPRPGAWSPGHARHHGRRVAVHATPRAEGGSQEIPESVATYRSSDGRLKAAAGPSFQRKAASGEDPWGFYYQVAERNLVWSEDLTARLLKAAVAAGLGLEEEEVEQRLGRLTCYLPDLVHKLPRMRAPLVQALVERVDEIPGRVLELRQVLPRANLGRMLADHPGVVLSWSARGLQDAVLRLEALLPGIDVERVIAEFPVYLDVEGVQDAIREAERLLPGYDVRAAMARDPEVIHSFQKMSAMIPYDPPGPVTDEECAGP